jgi:hypothetical protein
VVRRRRGIVKGNGEASGSDREKCPSTPVFRGNLWDRWVENRDRLHEPLRLDFANNFLPKLRSRSIFVPTRASRETAEPILTF